MESLVGLEIQDSDLKLTFLSVIVGIIIAYFVL